MSAQLFWVDRMDNSIVACIMAPLSQGSVARVSSEINGLFEVDRINAVVLDLKKNINHATSGLLSLIGNVKRLIRQTPAQLMVSGASREVIKYIHANGVGSDIHFIASLDMLKTREAPKFKLDVGFINPIIAATISTLETLSDLKPTLGKPTLRKDTASTVHDIAAILTIDAEVFSGHIAIGMDLASYRSILSRILGHAVEDDVDELASGANKILNAIYMESKTRLHAAGYTIRSARPSIMHAYQSSENATGIVVPMTVGGSTIIIEIIGESSTLS